MRNPCILFNHFIIFPTLLLLSGCSDSAEQSFNQIQYYRVDTHKNFEEVLDDTLFAITERNFRITGHLHIGQAIRDRNNPDFQEYEVILYCNLVYAKKMLELEPDMISTCPGRIALRQSDARVIITAPLWPEDSGNEALRTHLQKMNELIHEIVDYAADDWLLVYD